MKLEIGFGSCPQTVELPDETVLDVLYPNGIEAPKDSTAEVARALRDPIGTPPLAELAKGKQKVAIVTSDITRPMPSAVVLPLVLDELYRAGVRPESITVKLLRDGEPVENVKLNESNKWTHTWADLDADHEWTVVEAAVPDGYTTISDVEGDSTEITNTHTPPTTPDQPHTGADVQQAAWIAVAILGAGLVLLIVAKTALRKRA